MTPFNLNRVRFKYAGRSSMKKELTFTRKRDRIRLLQISYN